MAKFMINICYGNSAQKQSADYDAQFVMGKYKEWSQKIAARTLLAHKLKDNEGRKVDRSAGGKITDGPFIETKEAIGGFYLIEARDYAEAVAVAKECPTLLYGGGYVEVREVEF